MRPEKCPKCGNTKFGTPEFCRYRLYSRGEFNTYVDEEWLIYTCRRCGYEAKERPLDYEGEGEKK